MKAKIFMAKVIKLILGLCLLAAPSARAFSLLGPFTGWQVQALSYQWGSDIGGPMNLSEGFRWNIPVITYSYDRSFILYFGDEGVKAIDEAMRILNEVMPASKISLDLSEYSTQTLRENYEAETLGLFDLKSTALHFLVEELGLADPVRYTYTLRGRAVGTPPFTNYVTAFRNYDPVTREASRYVNGTLYTFEIQEFAAPFQHADAVEFPAAVGNEALENVPVATGGARVGDTGPNAVIAVGRFRVGLSRDDVGGLRYLYHKNNYAVEDLLPNITLGRRLDSAWQPFVNITNFVGVTNQFIGTNGLGTNVVSTGLRGGKNKLHFQKVLFDSILGTSFTPITNAYTDVVVSTNRALVVQPVLRPITVPDIIFSAGDLGLSAPPAIVPIITRRTDTSNWVDNDALNGFDDVDAEARGPGVIPPSITISFSDQFPSLISTDNAFLGAGSGEDFSFSTGYWGSFDGSTNPPVIFSKFGILSIQQLRNQILGGAPR